MRFARHELKVLAGDVAVPGRDIGTDARRSRRLASGARMVCTIEALSASTPPQKPEATRQTRGAIHPRANPRVRRVDA